MKRLVGILMLSLVLACDNGGDRQVPAVPPDSVSVILEPSDSDTVKSEQTPDSPKPEPSTPGFCIPDTACDTVGNRVLARTVDPSSSTFRIKPDNKLFSPGDTVDFEVCAVTAEREPVPGLPVVVRLKGEGARTLSGDGLTLTEEDGCVEFGEGLAHVIIEADMIGDPRTPEPDSGSRLVNAYVGGRLLNKVQPLHDSY